MNKFKVLVADPISPKGVELLKERGFDTVEAYGSTPEQVKELIKDADAVIVRSETKITADVLACAPKLKAVGRAGVGVDNIDIPAASEKGVVVMNTPTGNTIATAELTFTHMLCGTRPIAQANSSIHDGVWDRKSFKGAELKNKTLAVLGMGRIGAEVAKRAMAFGMKVLAYDPFLTEARAKTLGVEMVALEDAFKRADYITVHMPLTEATKYMIDEKAFDMMKKYPNLYMDMTPALNIYEELSLIRDRAEEFFLKHGDRVFFGTDATNHLVGEARMYNDKKNAVTSHFFSGGEYREICGKKISPVHLTNEILENLYYNNAMRFIGKEIK